MMVCFYLDFYRSQQNLFICLVCHGLVVIMILQRAVGHGKMLLNSEVETVLAFVYSGSGIVYSFVVQVAQ